MTVQHRPYTDNDLPDLQNALAMWIHEAGDLGYCHIGDIPHRIYNGIRGRLPRHELVKVWEASGEIIGIVLVGPYYQMFNIFLHPDYRGTQVEQDMLTQGYTIARHYMNVIGMAEKPVLHEVHQDDETRIQSALAVGFEAGEQYGNDTERSLNEPIPEPQFPEGFSIRSATMDDYMQIEAVHASAFGSGTWTPEIYRDEVMRKPGYLPEREIVVVAPDGQFAAFTVTWLDALNKIGYFEPVGVHKDFHRRGLGRAMMLHCLHEMKQLGMKTAQVGHEIDNPASTGLYNNLGFRTKHNIMDYIKS